MNLGTKRNIFFVILFGMMVVLWVYHFEIGVSGFSKSSSIPILTSIIQGMSALLSVSIAVIVFRIQSLENRNQLLEQTTLNYIFQISRFAYPSWALSVENDIRHGTIANLYYEHRVDILNRTLVLTKNDYEKRLKKNQKDRNMQQKRLDEALNRHTAIEQTIQRIRNGIFSSVALLIFPILASSYLLLVSDALNLLGNFFAVSLLVLISAFGVISLIMTIMQSTVQNDKSQEGKPTLTADLLS